jgi:putative transposase
MDETESLNQTKLECNYHVVFIPKRCGKTLYKQLRRYLEEVLRQFAKRKESRIEKGHLMADPLHMKTSIPQYAVSQVLLMRDSVSSVPFKP